MTVQTDLPRKWWTTAPNPPCQPWCTDEHDPQEFSRGGGMICHVVIDQADWFEVAVGQGVFTPLDDSIEGDAPLDPAYVSEWNARESSEHSLDDMERYARALLRGVEVARGLGGVE